MKKTLKTLLILVFITAMLTACTVATPVATPVVKDIMDENTDAMGQAVEESAAFTDEMTIISTAPSITEILFALGVGDQIVGVDASSNYPAEANDIERVGDYSGFDIEKVVGLEPSIVFAGNGLQNEQITALTDVGIKVIAVEPTYYDDIATSIMLIGEQIDKTDEAQALIDEIDAVAVAVENNSLAMTSHPTVYYAMTIGDSGYWTSGEGSFINTIIEMAGGNCITAGSDTEWPEYSAEDIIAADPDVLIVSSWITEESLLADPVMSELSAVINGNYLFISDDLINRPGPRIIETMTTIQDYLLGE
ncbi:MAG: ABC transporter substrate-binding protein [Eubacteriales bacterium]